MNFLNKVVFSFGFFISSTFLAYSMDTQKRDLKTVVGIISSEPNTIAQNFEFFECLNRIPVDSIRNYRIDETGNSLLHLAALYGKPVFVEKFLADKFFNLFEENNSHHNPIQLAIRNIELQSNSHEPNLDIIRANLTIIEMISAKEKSFKDDYFSHVLFLLIKCLARNGSDNLFDIINTFYTRNRDQISVDMIFEKTTAFDFAIDNDLTYILLNFLRTHNIDAKILNNRLEDLLIIASQNPGSSLLDAILEQSNLDMQLLCNLIHDNERAIRNGTRTCVLEFIKENYSHLLATPGAVIVADDAPELRLIRKTKSIDPSILEGLERLDLSDADDKS